MARWERALVTGASAGLGREFATQLAADGSDLVLVARSGPVLEQLASELRDAHGVEVEVLVADLVDRAALAGVEDRLASPQAPVDLLVNNAGYGSVGRLLDQDLDGQAAMVDLNATALLRLTHVAATRMAAAGRGGILNVSSLSSFQPIPSMATYAATKAFVSSLTEALHEELLGTGVHVTTLSPGFTRTSFAAAAGAEEQASSIPSMLWMEPGPVCAAGLAGVARNRAVVVPGVANRSVSTFMNSVPGMLKRKLGRIVNDTI